MSSLSRLELLNAVLSGLQSVVARLDLDRDRKPPALLWFLETLETLLVVEAGRTRLVCMVPLSPYLTVKRAFWMGSWGGP